MEANIDQIIRETQASIKQKVGHAEELLDAARREQQLLDALSVAKHQLEEKEAEKNHWKNRCTQAEKALDIERTRPINAGTYVEHQAVEKQIFKLAKRATPRNITTSPNQLQLWVTTNATST